MKIYNKESMGKFLKKLRKVTKILLCILIGIFTIIGILCTYQIRYERKNPRIMGNDSTYLKIYYTLSANLSQKYPQAKYFLGDINDKLGLNRIPFMVEEYAPDWKEFYDDKQLLISSGTHLSISESTSINLIIDSFETTALTFADASPRGRYVDVSPLQLEFTNTSLHIKDFLFYNPAFTSFFDPYQTIDFGYYGLDNIPISREMQGDFCLVFYSSSNILNSWIQKTPDCHIIIIPRTRDYPYAWLTTGISPLDSSQPATIKTIYPEQRQ